MLAVTYNVSVKLLTLTLCVDEAKSAQLLDVYFSVFVCCHCATQTVASDLSRFRCLHLFVLKEMFPYLHLLSLSCSCCSNKMPFLRQFLLNAVQTDQAVKCCPHTSFVVEEDETVCLTKKCYTGTICSQGKSPLR